MKTNPWRSIILLALSLGIILAFAYYLYVNADKYLHLLQISGIGLLALFILSLAFPFVNGLINTYMFQSLGADLSHHEGFLLAATASLANQLPVPGGIVTRGIYLKYKYDLSYTEYFSATLALFFCSVAINGFIGAGILAYWFLVEGAHVALALWIGFGLMAACLLIFWLPLRRVRVPERIGRRVDQALAGWTIISRDGVLLGKLLGLQTVLMLLFAARYWLAFHMLSQDVGVGQVVLLASASILTQLVSIAPGGLGVREVIVGGIASALHFDLTVSVAAVELDRLVATVAIVVVGWLSTVVLGKQLSRASNKPPEPPDGGG